MTRLFTFAAVTFGLAIAAAGCGSACTHACEQAQMCPAAATRACSFTCDDAERSAGTASCASQWQAWQACIDAPPDGAYCADDAMTRCAPDHDTYAACIDTYCATHADAPVCTAIGR